MSSSGQTNDPCVGAGGVGDGGAVVSAGVVSAGGVGDGVVLVVVMTVVSALPSQSHIFSSSFQTRSSGQGMSYAMPASLH